MSEYKSYKVISLRDDPPANCLWVNETLLHLPADHRYGESIRVFRVESKNFFRFYRLTALDINEPTRSNTISHWNHKFRIR